MANIKDVHNFVIKQIWDRETTLEKKVIESLNYIQRKAIFISDKGAAFLTLIMFFEASLESADISGKVKERILVDFVKETFPDEYFKIKEIWENDKLYLDTQRISQSLEVIEDLRLPSRINQTDNNTETGICCLFALVYFYCKQSSATGIKMTL